MPISTRDFLFEDITLPAFFPSSWRIANGKCSRVKDCRGHSLASGSLCCTTTSHDEGNSGLHLSQDTYHTDKTIFLVLPDYCLIKIGYRLSNEPRWYFWNESSYGYVAWTSYLASLSYFLIKKNLLGQESCKRIVGMAHWYQELSLCAQNIWARYSNNFQNPFNSASQLQGPVGKSVR